MQYADPNLDWVEWVEENEDRDEATKLAALREYIAALGESWAGRENMTPGWINKKLTKLGITDLVSTRARYALTAPATGTLTIAVTAYSRTEALQEWQRRISNADSFMVTDPKPTADPQFTDGPEDPDPVAPDGAPQTVAETLNMLREIIMLAHISGPKICEAGANSVLKDFGLAEIPPRKSFKISRPVQAVAETLVEAYDEESAMRVAGWRWEDGKHGYQMSEVQATDAPSVAQAV